MKNNKLLVVTRVLLAMCGVALIFVLFTPIWRIELNAPQYPEGLALQIHANDIKGDVAIINGLNHYIGMKTLHTADFPEFTILPYCIVFFVVLFLATAIVNRIKLFYTSFLLFVVFGILAMVDFWKWEYNYGHNLDPHAAIVVRGMAYQPPLIGFKQLLNFGAYSIPDTGGWLFLACGALLLACVALQWKQGVKLKRSGVALLAGLLVVTAMSGCATGPEPLKVGKDNCSNCKMTIADARFGAELVTKTGKVFKFDDIRCLLDFLKTLDTITAEEAICYFADFGGRHELVQANTAVLLKDSEIKCPMQGNAIAFANADSLKKVMEVYKGSQTNWPIK